MMQDFLETLKARGFIHQITDEAGILELKNPTAYVGYDCTADSLHVGSLLSIMMLRHFQQHGGKPIILMGGGTTRVGDPSGKDEARQLLTDEVIEQNMAGIKRIFNQFISFGDGKSDAVMVNNADWLSNLNYIDFLRDYGRHFSVNRMLSFDSVKLRLDREQPLSFLEFNYMILQAYDFMNLAKNYDCNMQFGGSDQWGNIVNGIELGRRVKGQALYGITTPLLTTTSGAKMGKTAGGAVWLNKERLAPYDYYQFWRNCEDGDVIRFLKLFTEIPLNEIDKMATLQGAELNEAKQLLAYHATALCHGEKAAKDAESTAKVVFEGGGLSDDLPTLELSELSTPVYALLTEIGFTNSNGEARRMIKNKGVRINDKVVERDDAMLCPDDFTDNVAKLSMGKKRHGRIVYK